MSKLYHKPLSVNHHSIRPVLNAAAQRHEVSINGVVVGFVPVPRNGLATARLITRLRYQAATREGAA
jgi:hypothetical protein